MMSYWLDDPQLFLYAKGTGPDDVILRRCKKPMSSSSSSLLVPMKSDDFEYESDVKNYRLLIRDEFEWDETDYKRLVKYIYERLLLVNRQGLVIAEIYKLDDANLVVPIYIRSLDVLPLKPYIPNIRERLIPLRTVKCLEDVNGKAAAMMEEKDSNVTELTTRVNDLESKNKTLEGKVTELMTALTTLQEEVKNINPNSKEVWMNDITNSEWVGVGGLLSTQPYDDFILVATKGIFKVDDKSTNVWARYWYKIRLSANSQEVKVVSLEDLSPNKERARFLQGRFYSFASKGKPYVYGYI